MGFDFIVDHRDDKEESLEVPFHSDSDEGLDGEAEPATQKPAVKDSMPTVKDPISNIQA